jgi:hypothetical protein
MAVKKEMVTMQIEIWRIRSRNRKRKIEMVLPSAKEMLIQA